MKYQTKLITEVGVFTYEADYLETLNAIELAKSTSGILMIHSKGVTGTVGGEVKISEVTTYVNVKDLVILAYEEHKIEESKEKKSK